MYRHPTINSVQIALFNIMAHSTHTSPEVIAMHWVNSGSAKMFRNLWESGKVKFH